MAKTSARVRISLDVPGRVDDDLERYAAQAGTTKSDILRKAIGLIGVAVEAKANGQKLGVLDANRQLITEIVGL